MYGVIFENVISVHCGRDTSLASAESLKQIPGELMGLSIRANEIESVLCYVSATMRLSWKELQMYHVGCNIGFNLDSKPNSKLM